MSGMPDPSIQLPIEFDVLATFVSAVAGALVAVRRGYDYVGVFALAFVTGLGGALLRDGIFLQTGPAAVVRDSRIILAVLAATLVSAAINQLGRRLSLFVLVFDAVGLGVYVGLTACLTGYERPAAVAGAAAGVAMRLLAVRYDWKTRPLYWKDWKQHRGSVG